SEIHDAQDVLSGPSSPLPQLASLLRRLQRKVTEAPGLLEDVVKSLDEAMLSLDAAQSGVEAALRATEYDPRRLEQAEER
ncbi:MAG: DNA repair protein RecN, partial [Mesorhizobium sp.]